MPWGTSSGDYCCKGTSLKHGRRLLAESAAAVLVYLGSGYCASGHRNRVLGMDHKCMDPNVRVISAAAVGYRSEKRAAMQHAQCCAA